ncbi:NACHT domain-containing protein [Pseudonocardiaceae bacterium YIM PH 21723]|nr:NACHT domain-containing protein [Pseudonocardiaceae bacterium YIM PH 21723]
MNTFLSKGFGPLGKLLIGYLARFRSLQAYGMARYRTSLRKKYASFESPQVFEPQHSRPMSEAYLPVRVLDADPAPQPIDAVMDGHRHLVVTGDPGAGKSMLLRHLAHTFADKGWEHRNDPMPLIIELRTLELSDRSLQHRITEKLKPAGFFQNDKFVSHTLERGDLLLLLDGLDEVGSARRSAVAHQILEFKTDYPKCPLIVTCRSSVREAQLWSATHQVRLAGLDDDLVHGFVRTRFADRPAEADRLTGALFTTPRLLELARTPLLLTLMTSVYGARKEIGFPTSRAQFYQDVVGWLLDRRPGEGGADPDRAQDKHLVLQQLALRTQEQPDSLTLDAEAAELVVRERLDVDRPYARGLLREIVEHSGLLHRSENLGYEFTHLTFQEFLTAQALTDPADLLRRFTADPSRWQESVVLWCGGHEDVTPLLTGLLDTAPVVAVECLGEAREVPGDLVDRLITAAQGREGAARAFGIAAAGPGPAAQRVLAHLGAELTERDDDRHEVAADALAVTGTVEAARILAGQADRAEAFNALVELRDVAVETFVELAEQGNADGADGLAMIDTPAAIHALADMLWSADTALATRAAGLLGEVLTGTDPDVEFAGWEPGDRRGVPEYQWVGVPMADTPVAQLVIGKLSSILAAREAAGTPLDPRIGVALDLVDPRRPADPEVPLDGLAEPRRAQILQSLAFGQPRVDEWRRLRDNDDRLPIGTWVLIVLAGLEGALLLGYGVDRLHRMFFPSTGFTWQPLRWLTVPWRWITAVWRWALPYGEWLYDRVARWIGIGWTWLLQLIDHLGRSTWGFSLLVLGIAFAAAAVLGLFRLIIELMIDQADEFLDLVEGIAGFILGAAFFSVLLVLPSMSMAEAMGDGWWLLLVWPLLLIIPGIAAFLFWQAIRDETPFQRAVRPLFEQRR